MKLISIITVVFNDKKGFERCISNIKKIKNKQIEYIVIDGNSTDGTKEVIKNNINLIDLKVSENDHGIYDAMNKGIKIARGKYIGFLHCNDEFYPENFNQILKTIIFSNYDVFYGNYNVFKNKNFIKYFSTNHLKLKLSMSHVGHVTTFVKNEIYKKYLFDIKYSIAADYDLFLKLYRSDYSFKKIDTTICNFDAGLSSNLIKTSLEVFNIKAKYFGLIFATKSFILTYCNLFINKINKFI